MSGTRPAHDLRLALLEAESRLQKTLRAVPLAEVDMLLLRARLQQAEPDGRPQAAGALTEQQPIFELVIKVATSGMGAQAQILRLMADEIERSPGQGAYTVRDGSGVAVAKRPLIR